MKQNFIKLVFSILFFISFGFFINFYVDSYGIFGNNLEYQSLEPNQNYLKTKYILENPKKFNGFIFGSSRIGNIPTEEIINYKVYNMTYSEGLPQEWEQTLNIFINNDIVPEIILLGIDDFDFKVKLQTHEKQQMRKPYIKVNLMRDYILVNPFTRYNFIKLKDILFSNKNKDFESDFKEHGRLDKRERIKKEEEIKINSINYLEQKVFKERNYYSYLDNTQKEIAIASLNNIVNLCEENNIQLIFLFNPVHPKAYKDDKAQIEYREIRGEIKKKFKNIKVYDFAEHEITKDNLYWFETSHFNTKVGRMMLEQIIEINLKN